MSRNKVKNAHSLQGAAVLKWVVVGTLFVVLGGSYVACKNKVLRLAAEVHGQEVELDTWQRRNNQVKCEVIRLTSIDELKRKTQNMGLVSISELDWHRGDSGSETAVARGAESKPFTGTVASTGIPNGALP